MTIATSHRQGARTETAEHLTRLADGGRNIPENVVAACFECNQRRAKEYQKMPGRNDFKVGDLVELKSGSPDMTVTAITPDGVCVAWCGEDFGSGVLHQTELPFAAIQRVPAEAPPAYPASPFAISHGGPRMQPKPDLIVDDDIPF